MNNTGRYSGIIPPLVIPLTSDERLDEKGLRKLIDFVLEGGCSGIFINGSCGEAMRVTDSVWERAMNVALEHAEDRVPVFCGAIDSSTSRELEKIEKIRRAGGEVAVCTVPFYHHVFADEEIIRHYERLNDEGGMKLAVYNIPDTTHTNIPVGVMAKLVKLENVAVVKDSCADFQQLQRELTLVKDLDVAFFNGAEELVGPSTLFGATGNIPGMACFFPRLFVDLFNAAKAGQLERTIELQRQATRLRDTLFVGVSFLASMKYMLEYLGIASANLSYPMLSLDEEAKGRVRAIIHEVNG